MENALSSDQVKNIQASKDAGYQLKGGLKPYQKVDGVEVFGVAQILDHHEPDWCKKDYDVMNGIITRWILAMGASFYADEKEDFFIRKGVEIAKREGKRRLVVENLS
jgi:hypothetical protein